MANKQDQVARFLSQMKLATRASVAGIAAPTTKEEKKLFAHVESQNTAVAKAAALNAPSKKDVGLVNYPGAPKTLAESGLAPEGFTFDESQQAALRKILHGKHVCLIGAAGTGKTTLVKYALANIIYGGEGVENPIGIRQLSGEQGPSIAICAFTAVAVQVIMDTLPDWLKPSCKTIHSTLEYRPVSADSNESGMFVPSRTASNKMDYDIVVIDESSMLGLDLWHNVIDAARPNTRFILIGDLNQLKPVADATMFAYALSAGIDQQDGWDVAELTTIHRQKEVAANRIVDAAYAILNGKNPVFDKLTDPDWRIIGHELPPQATKAHDAILQVIKTLSNYPTPLNPTRPIFDPYQDLLLTAGNGDDENDSTSFVQQISLNGSISRMVEPPTEEHPVYIVDAGRETKRFAVGYRVMATKNEAPTIKDRVVNGMIGRVVKIESNPSWNGNRSMFGTEAEVMAFRSEKVKNALSNEINESFLSFRIEDIDTSKLTAKVEDTERQASHIVTIKFRNGAERTYRSSSDVSRVQLAYAMTVHKAQGSQADTVVVVVHQAVKRQLSREWLYTAVTRAKRRLIILYTQMGLSSAIHKQQIYGANLREKVNRYRQTMSNGNVMVRLKARDVLFENDTTQISED